jgi:hypothetical protein
MRANAGALGCPDQNGASDTSGAEAVGVAGFGAAVTAFAGAAPVAAVAGRQGTAANAHATVRTMLNRRLRFTLPPRQDDGYHAGR